MKKLFILIIGIVLVAAGAFLFIFNQNGNNEFSQNYDKFQVVIEGELPDKKDFARIDGQYYFSTDLIKEYLDKNINYDEVNHSVVIKNNTGTKVLPLESKKATINGGEIGLRDPLFEKSGKIYVPVEAFIYDYPVKIRYNKDQNVLTMDYNTVKYATAHPKGNGVNMRESDSIKSPIVKTLNKDADLYVYAEEGDWYHVRERNGYAGWIRGDNINVKDLDGQFIVDRPKEDYEKASAIAKPINITWDYTYGPVKEETINGIKPVKGLDVMIPTWFSINNAEGEIYDRGNKKYVETYKAYGIDTWGFIDNKFDPELTHAFLSNEEARKKAVADLLKRVKDYGMTGINVDFENIKIEDRDLLTEFVSELYDAFHPEGLLVSVDVTPQISGNVKDEVYDRKALSEVSDYVILMAYDQYWSNAEEAGSVAEYKWVEGNINLLLNTIPKEKFILGIPFYSRIWTEEGNNVKSRTAGMTDMHEFIAKHQLEPKWDDDAKQNYVQADLNGTNERLWIEDGESVRWKASLIRKYNLAGVASWRYGFETPNVWDTISREMSYYHYMYQ